MNGSGPFDPNLDRRIEARARLEFEAAELEAAVLAARRRRLVDVAWEAVHSGRRIRVRVGDREVGGTPVYARNDLVSLETTGGLVEVYLPNVDALVVTSRSGEGRSVHKEVDTFAARMAMLELSREHVEIVCRGGEPRFEGKIDHVARDHVSVKTALGTVLVALQSIAYLVRRPRIR